MKTSRPLVAAGVAGLVLIALAACSKQQDVKDPTPAKLDGVATANPVAPGATVAPSASTGLPAAMPAYK